MTWRTSATVLLISAPILCILGIAKFWFSLGAAAVRGDGSGVLIGCFVYLLGGFCAFCAALTSHAANKKAKSESRVIWQPVFSWLVFFSFVSVIVWYFSVVV